MTSNPALSEHDYEAIEGAVVETARGRWFLAEYARRNRNADTTMLMAALERIEAVVRGERSVPSIDKVRFDLVEMAKAISRTKAEIAAIKPDAEQHGKFGEATEELDSIVQATESATSDILAAAEQLQEIAWTLREQGLESEVCDLIDSKATDVYTACSFQDLTGQRTRKVIGVLGYLESRINAMIGIWGLDGAITSEAATRERAPTGDAALLNGPARPGQGLDQADVDMVMGPAVASPPQDRPHERLRERTQEQSRAPSASSQAERRSDLAVAEARSDAPPLQPKVAAAPTRTIEPKIESSRFAISESEADAFLAMPRAGLGPMAQAMVSTPDPLAAVAALSYEEKIALFS